MMGRDRHACLMPMGIVTDGQTRGETGGGGAGIGQTDGKRAEEEGQR